MKKITLTEKEIKEIKNFVKEVSDLSVVEGVLLTVIKKFNNQDKIVVEVLKNYTVDYYEKFVEHDSFQQYIQEQVTRGNETLYLIMEKYNASRSEHYIFLSNQSIIYNTTLFSLNNMVNVNELINANILFDRFGHLNFLQEKYSKITHENIYDSTFFIDNIYEVLYDFPNDQTKEKYSKINSSFLEKFLNSIIRLYSTYGQKPNVLIKEIALISDHLEKDKMNVIMGYNITFSVDNNLLKLSNYGLNHSMKLTQEDGITKYYNGLNLVSIKYELPENPHIKSVSVCDKELKQYKITFELTNNNSFIIDIQCDNNYYLLNEPTNLVNYLKNNHININNINELYNIIIKFINPHSCTIKITDKEENYLFYNHNILSNKPYTRKRK